MKKKEFKNSVFVPILCSLILITILFINRKCVSVTNATDLINTYETNETNADKTYKNKVCILSGIICAMIDENGKFVDTLDSGTTCNGVVFLKENDNKISYKPINFVEKTVIFCYFKKGDKKSSTYKVGRKITLRGKITGISHKPYIFGNIPLNLEEKFFMEGRAEDLTVQAINLENCEQIE